jgi:hypothetical protein
MQNIPKLVPANTYNKNLLTLEIYDEKTFYMLKWFGRSIEMNPDSFILPLMLNYLERARLEEKELVFDFQSLNYMNSITITYLCKVLESGKAGNTRITLYYDIKKKWQDLTFTTLKIFQTRDDRIRILGKKQGD